MVVDAKGLRTKEKKQFGGVSLLKLGTEKMKKPCHAFIHSSKTSSLLESLATRLLRNRLPSLNKCYLSSVHNQNHSSPYLFLSKSKNLVAKLCPKEKTPHPGHCANTHERYTSICTKFFIRGLQGLRSNNG